MHKSNLKPAKVLLLFLVLIANAAFAQKALTISGTVSDDKGVLPGATVFLTGTQFMTATNLSGEFTLNKIPPGNYSLIVKMMGFAPFLKQFMIGEENVTLNIVLKENISQLQEVVVRPDKECFKNLEMFKTQFLGESANAKQCKILNAEVLALSYDKNTRVLKASSDDLLKIENDALGYKITYLLTNFEYNTRNNTVVYQGYPSFELMKGTAEEESDWEERRARAYKGSIQHFITSLYNNNTSKQGFLVFELPKWEAGKAGYVHSDTIIKRNRINIDALISSVNSNYKKVNFSKPLLVVYLKQHEDAQYQAARYSLSQLYRDKRLDEGQSSVINLLAPSVIIDAKGAFYRTQDLFFEGYMGWQKIANLTPFGYTGG